MSNQCDFNLQTAKNITNDERGSLIKFITTPSFYYSEFKIHQYEYHTVV